MNDFPILLVEDDANDVFFFERALRLAAVSHPLRVVRDGREALAYFTGDAPYCDRASCPLPVLVVLDLNLPQKTGLQVLKWIREHAPQKDVPVVILTSSTSLRDRQQADSLGATAYLIKPSEPDVLAEMVRQLKRNWLDDGHARWSGNNSGVKPATNANSSVPGFNPRPISN